MAAVVAKTLALLLLLVGVMSSAASNACTPQIQAVNNTLTFVVQNGQRVGYRVGDDAPVYFDQLPTADNVIAAAFAMGASQCEAVDTAMKLQKVELGLEAVQDKLNVTTKKLETAIQDRIDAVTQLNARVDSEASDRALAVQGEAQDRSTALNSAVSTLNADISQVVAAASGQAARIDALEDLVKRLADAADEATTGGVGQQLLWLSTLAVGGRTEGGAPVLSRAPRFVSTTVEVFGVGFEAFYHPRHMEQVSCTFTPDDGAPTSVQEEVTAGSVVEFNGAFHVECPTPVVEADATFNLSLAFSETIPIPYHGPLGRNKVRFAQYWSTDKNMVPGELVIKGEGFDETATYTIKLEAPSPAGDGGTMTRTLTSKSVSRTTIVAEYAPADWVHLDLDAERRAKIDVTVAGYTKPVRLFVSGTGDSNNPFRDMEEVAILDKGSGFFHFQFDESGPIELLHAHKDANNKYWVLVGSVVDDLTHGRHTGGTGDWKNKWTTSAAFGSSQTAKVSSFQSHMYANAQASDMLIMQGFAANNNDNYATSSEVAFNNGILASRGGNMKNMLTAVGLNNHGAPGGTKIGGWQFLKGSAASSRNRYRSNSKGELSADNTLHVSPANCEGYTFSIINALGCSTNGCNNEHHAWVGNTNNNYSQRNFPEPNWDSSWGINAGNHMYWLFYYH